jgi:LmbE family N-acetylglucosaminyl deacetylase
MHLGFTQLDPLANRQKLLAISPHLDDVALGCADLVAAHPSALVVTVIAGRPGPHELTDWDRQCGFGPDDDVMGARREEDAAAMRLLEATPMWLDFLDRQYAAEWTSPKPDEVAAALRPLAGEAALVASPLGMLHPDHVAVAQACFALAHTMHDLRWLVYEDAIYRATDGASSEATARLIAAGFTLKELAIPPAERKRKAIACYTSQVKGLGGLLEDAYRPERYWELGR